MNKLILLFFSIALSNSAHSIGSSFSSPAPAARASISAPKISTHSATIRVSPTTSKPVPTLKIDTSKPIKASSFKNISSSKDYHDVYKQYKQSFEKPKFSYSDLKRYQTIPKYERRKEYYGGYTPKYYSAGYTTPAPVANSYGPWDGIALYSIADGIGDAMMMYSHQNDPYIKQWREEANKLAESDMELKKKLADLDSKMKAMEAAKIPKDDQYITPGIDPDIYEAEVDKSKLPKIKFCGSSLSGDYYSIGFMINQKTKINVESIQSDGSKDNIDKINNGICDVGLVQSDVFNGTSHPNIDLIGDIKTEPAILVCNSNLKMVDMRGLGDSTVYVGTNESGSSFTLDMLKQKHSGLKNTTIEYRQSVLDAIEMARNNSKGCFFTVTDPDSKFITNIGNKTDGRLHIASIDVALNPNSQYILVDILTRRYNSKFTSGFSGGVPSIAVYTDLVVNKKWKESNKQVYDILLLELGNIRVMIDDR